MVLTNCKHENIVHLIDTFVNKSYSKDSNSMYLILEYMDHDLNSLILNNVSFTLPNIRNIIHQILLGCDYLHSNNIIHRDLKSDNILLNNDGTVKIGDFGLSRRVNSYNKKKYTTNVVAVWYRAPELLVSSSNECDYDFGIDIWSIGCILVELLTGEPPFRSNSEFSQIIEISKYYPNFIEKYEKLIDKDSIDKFKNNLSEKLLREKIQEKMEGRKMDDILWDLISKMLEIDPAERITVKQALNHDFFNEYEERPINCFSGECHKVILKPTNIDDVLSNVKDKNIIEKNNLVLPELQKYVPTDFYIKDCRKGIVLSMENEIIKKTKQRRKIDFSLDSASTYISKSLNDKIIYDSEKLKNIFA